MSPASLLSQQQRLTNIQNTVCPCVRVCVCVYAQHTQIPSIDSVCCAYRFVCPPCAWKPLLASYYRLLVLQGSDYMDTYHINKDEVCHTHTHTHTYMDTHTHKHTHTHKRNLPASGVI